MRLSPDYDQLFTASIERFILLQMPGNLPLCNIDLQRMPGKGNPKKYVRPFIK